MLNVSLVHSGSSRSVQFSDRYTFIKTIASMKWQYLFYFACKFIMLGNQNIWLHIPSKIFKRPYVTQSYTTYNYGLFFCSLATHESLWLMKGTEGLAWPHLLTTKKPSTFKLQANKIIWLLLIQCSKFPIVYPTPWITLLLVLVKSRVNQKLH